MRETEIILKDLKLHLQENLGDYIKEVILFGSRTTNSFSKDSDYDILIIVSKKSDWMMKRKISDLCYDIDLKFDIITDTHIIAESEFNELRGKQPIFQTALQKGIFA